MGHGQKCVNTRIWTAGFSSFHPGVPILDQPFEQRPNQAFHALSWTLTALEELSLRDPLLGSRVTRVELL